MKWIEVRAEVDGPLLEAAASAFIERGVGGVAIEEGPFYAVTAYFPDTTEGRWRAREAKRAIAALPAFFHPGSVKGIRCQKRANEEWEGAWKEHYKPLTVGPFRIVPVWEKEKVEGERVIRLDPGLAFGTGQHTTTQMCLEALARRVAPRMRVLDIGTGSGILAVAAALLGSPLVWGIDTDPVAVRSSLQNVKFNGLDGRVRILRGGIDAWRERGHGPLELAVANITAGVIEGMVPSLSLVLKPGGIFIAGGIVKSREEAVIRALSTMGFSLEQKERRDGWSCLVVRR